MAATPEIATSTSPDAVARRIAPDASAVERWRLGSEQTITGPVVGLVLDELPGGGLRGVMPVLNTVSEPQPPGSSGDHPASA